MATLLILARLCLLLLVLYGASRALGALFARLNQPPLVGEILAGLLLGVSGLGTLWPAAHQGLFTGPGVAGLLEVVSWTGLAALMFSTGLEARAFTRDPDWRGVVGLSLAGLVVPMMASMAIAWTFDFSAWYGPLADPWRFGIYLGLAMAVAAIPVIARLFRDLRLMETRFAHLVLTVAFLQDVTLWVGMAVLAGVPHGPREVAAALGQWVTFLAFAAGRALWEGWPAWRARLEVTSDRVSAGVVPMFFATVGLNLDLHHGFSLAMLAAMALVSVGFKTLGSWLGGLWAGFEPKVSLHLAMALNTRGAVGIVLATMGLHAGLISGGFYAVLVLVSLLTTQLSGAWLGRVARKDLGELELVRVRSAPESSPARLEGTAPWR